MLACKDCLYGQLQAHNDPEGRMLEICKGIHGTTFRHTLEIREADAEDFMKYSKSKK